MLGGTVFLSKETDFQLIKLDEEKFLVYRVYNWWSYVVDNNLCSNGDYAMGDASTRGLNRLELYEYDNKIDGWGANHVIKQFGELPCFKLSKIN